MGTKSRGGSLRACAARLRFRLGAELSGHPVDAADDPLGTEFRDDRIQVLQIPNREIDRQFCEVMGPSDHRDIVDVPVMVGDDLRDLGKRARLVQAGDRYLGREALGSVDVGAALSSYGGPPDTVRRGVAALAHIADLIGPDVVKLDPAGQPLGRDPGL